MLQGKRCVKRSDRRSGERGHRKARGRVSQSAQHATTQGVTSRAADYKSPPDTETDTKHLNTALTLGAPHVARVNHGSIALLPPPNETRSVWQGATRLAVMRSIKRLRSYGDGGSGAAHTHTQHTHQPSPKEKAAPADACAERQAHQHPHPAWILRESSKSHRPPVSIHAILVTAVRRSRTNVDS